MTLPATPWHARVVRLGRARTLMVMTTISVSASVLIVAVFAIVFDAAAEDLPKYFVPAVIVPLLVAPVVSNLLLGVAYALDEAYAQAARQQEALLRAQQLDLVGRLASGLAHDFNNLLTVVRANVSALGGATTSVELAAIDDAAVRGARLTRRLLSISQHDEFVLVSQPLAPLIHETHDVLRRVLPSGISLALPPSIPDTVLAVDRDAVQQALLNLVLNARDAMGDRGQIVLMVTQRDEADGRWLVVDVRDNGPGMTPEQLARATEPFFTTKAAHEGTGLGLAIVRRSMEQHGGRFVLASTLGVGTSAALWFPIPHPSTTETAGPIASSFRVPSARSDAASRAKVGAACLDLLVVEDEPAVRIATVRTLERLGHRVHSVESGAAALDLLATGAPVDVILSDVMMPGGTGIELLHALRAAGYHTPVLLVTGFTSEILDATVQTDTSVAFLAKPWTLEALIAGIEEVRPSAERDIAPV